MRSKSKLVNVLVLATATYFLKKWLIDDQKEAKSAKEPQETPEELLERKKNELADHFNQH